tara:strand:- start:355 stop:615 length:261 start_codon:yes stop_codon:yes gene_type:complete
MENKEKIKQLRARIARLKELMKAYDSGEPSGMKQRKDVLAEIAKLESQIAKILEVGNGDGSGRKPIGAITSDPALYSKSKNKTKPM